jgi:hypothetical protein
MVATIDSLSKTESGITFPHEWCRWRCSRTCVDLKIVMPRTTTGSASVLGHTYSSTMPPLFQWGSGNRDPPKLLLLLHFSKCWQWTIYGSISLSVREFGGATTKRRRGPQGVCEREEEMATLLQERGQHPVGVRRPQVVPLGLISSWWW